MVCLSTFMPGTKNDWYFARDFEYGRRKSLGRHLIGVNGTDALLLLNQFFRFVDIIIGKMMRTSILPVSCSQQIEG